MQLEQIRVGDVLTTVRGDIVCVTEVKPESANPIRFQIKVGKTYLAKTDFFVSKVGTFDPDSLRVASDNRFGSLGLPKDQQTGSFFMPQNLKAMGLKVGEEINIRHGGSTRRAVFEGYHASRPKYPISYTINGKRWKGPENCIIGKVQ